MNRIFISLLLLMITGSVFGQINIKDSTVQVVGYWDKNEKQTYKLMQCKYKIVNKDTISRDTTTSDIYLTVIDSTANSYTTEWLYKNIKANNTPPGMQKIIGLMEDTRVLVKTSETGVFQEIINWKEISEKVQSLLGQFKPQVANLPGADKMIDQMTAIYATKESIEHSAFEEIPLFYTFHGGKYKLQEELQGKVKLPNVLGGEPFDGNMTVWLDEIRPKDDENFSVLRTIQTVDKDQMIEAVSKFVNKMGSNMGVAAPLKKEDLQDMDINIQVAMSVHNSGWPLYGVITKEVSLQGTKNINELSLELQ